MKVRKEIKKKVALILLFLALYNLFLISISKAKGPIIVKGLNFNIYLPSGSNITFQHLETTYSKAFKINLTVNSGNLNGSNGKLTMWTDSGEMSFISQDSATIEGKEILMLVEGDQFNEKANIVAGNIVILKWSNPYVYKPLLPIMFIFGMVGLGGIFGGPLYAIHQIRKKEYRDGFVNGLVVTVTGVAFVLAWLWS